MPQDAEFYVYLALTILFFIIKFITQNKKAKEEKAAQQVTKAAHPGQSRQRQRAKVTLPPFPVGAFDAVPPSIPAPNVASAENKSSVSAAMLPEEGVRITSTDSPAPMKASGPTKEQIERHREKWRKAIINAEILTPRY